jgi:hypothetical protein
MRLLFLHCKSHDLVMVTADHRATSGGAVMGVLIMIGVGIVTCWTIGLILGAYLLWPGSVPARLARLARDVVRETGESVATHRSFLGLAPAALTKPRSRG